MDAMECSYLICIAGALHLFVAVGGITVENNSPAILSCTIAQGDYPSWFGPPMVNNVSTVYINQQDPMFNPALSEDKLHRMTWAGNKRDLSFSAVKQTDEGKYNCSWPHQGTLTIALSVRVPPAFPIIYNTATSSDNVLRVSGTEGTPLTLTCISVGGYPQQMVNWYRESVTSTTLQADPPDVVSGDLYNVTRSYTFTPNSSDDGATYICQSSYSGEPQLIRNTTVKLFLKLQPSTPTITILGIPNESSSSVNVAQCTSFGFRPQTVSLIWIRGGGTEEPVSNPSVTENTSTSTFSVSDTYSRAVGRADNGKTLTCSINHETLSSPQNASVTLTVQFPPNDAALTGKFTIVADGSSKTITCTTGTSKPDAVITWQRNNAIVTAGTGTPTYTTGSYNGRLTTQTLTITPRRDDDGDVYSCSAWNAVSRTPADSQQKTLTLTYSPEVYATSRAETETQPGLLRCLVSSKPAGTIKWYRTDNRQTFLLEGTGNSSLDYHFGAVSRDDAGAYKCTANNGIGGDNSSTVQLVVHYKPDVTVIAGNATENSTSTLRCEPHGEPDSYTYISWEHTWPGSSHVLRILPGSAVLTLSDLRYEHTGIYTCRVGNGVEFSRNPKAGQGQVFFVVKSRPFVTTDQRTIQKAAQLGNVTTIQVEFVSNSLGLVVKVEKRGNDTATQSTRFNTTTISANMSVVVFNTTVQAEGFLSEINITILNQDYFGLYDIVIENDVGIEKRAVNLVPKGPPSPPHIISITHVTETSALLTWKRGFHGGSDQSVKVEISRDGASWTQTLSLPQGTLADSSSINTTINELIPAFRYYLRMFSTNEEGESSKTDVFNFTTIDTGGPRGSPFPLIIGGVVGGTAAAAVIIVTLVLLVRKFNWKWQGRKEDSSRLTGEHRLHSLQEKQNDSYGDDEVINPIYDSQENNETKPPPVENLYAQPNKAKKNGLAIHPSDIYADVNKEKKGKKKTKKAAKQEQDNNQVYSNEGFDKSGGQTVKKNVNKDGLLYADIVFANPPKSQKRLVIHGLDDMTDYATVDLTKTADPLPDSDEEDAKH